MHDKTTNSGLGSAIGGLDSGRGPATRCGLPRGPVARPVRRQVFLPLVFASFENVTFRASQRSYRRLAGKERSAPHESSAGARSCGSDSGQQRTRRSARPSAGARAAR